MSSGFSHFEVHWAQQSSKKHKIWSTGILKWNSANSKATLYDEDGSKVLGEGFIIGGAVIGKEYEVGPMIIEVQEARQQTPSSSPQPIVSPNLSPPPAKRRQLHAVSSNLKSKRNPIYSKTENQNLETCETNNAPIAAPPKPKTTYRQKPFIPPARIEPSSPKKTIEEAPKEENQLSNNSQFLAVSEPQTPSAPSNYVPIKWSTFLGDLQEVKEEKNQIQKPILNDADENIDYLFLPVSETLEEQDRPRMFQAVSMTSKARKPVVVEAPPPLMPRGTVHPSHLAPNQNNTKNSPFSNRSDPRKSLTIEKTTSEKKSFEKPNFVQQSFDKTNIDKQSLDKPAFDKTSFDKPTFDKPILDKVATFPKPTQTISKIDSPLSAPFRPPVIVNPHDLVLGFRSTVLSFPSTATISQISGKQPRRSVDISTSHSSLEEYKKQFAEAIYEEINHSILPIATHYHEIFNKVFPSSENSKKRPRDQLELTQPHKSKIINYFGFKQVYYDCELVSYSSFSNKKKFKSNSTTDSDSNQVPSSYYLKLSSSDQEPSTSFLKDDLWIISSVPSFEPHSPGDIFFLARSTMHGKSSTVMEIKPIFEGSYGSNIRLKPPKIDGEVKVHLIHGPSVGNEFNVLENLLELNQEQMPLLPIILTGKYNKLGALNSQDFDSNISVSNSSQSSFGDSAIDSTSPFIDCGLHRSTIDEILHATLQKYKLNEDQSKVLIRAASWFNARTSFDYSPITLVHGVFGSGKSHMLVVLIMFICEILDKIVPADESQARASSYSPHSHSSYGINDTINQQRSKEVRPEDIRILISSATNTAVDRILVGLLDEGFTNFVRVGSLKRINSRILPYSIHRDRKSKTKDKGSEWSDRLALKDLDELLHSRGLSSWEKALIEQQKKDITSGKFEAKMELVDEARVVGATCIASSFPILNGRKFNIVILDECSQMPEPLSLLPAGKFCSKSMILVGDPMQLPPQLKSKPKNDGDENQGIGRTLFSRMVDLGHSPIMLKTQYRLHPILSAPVNRMFYQGKLINGVDENQRKQLIPSLPTLLVVDAMDGAERTAKGGSVENPYEAHLVGKIVEALVSRGITGSQIGVICLYKAQENLVTEIIRRIAQEAANKSSNVKIVPKSNSIDSSSLNTHNKNMRDNLLGLDENNLSLRMEFGNDVEDKNQWMEEEQHKQIEENQAISIEDELSQIQVSTVDAFQGAEKDVIILTSCRTEWRGFIDSPNRMNVSLTRAKRHLILVGNVATLQGSDQWRQVIETARSCGPRSFVAGHVIQSDAFF